MRLHLFASSQTFLEPSAQYRTSRFVVSYLHIDADKQQSRSKLPADQVALTVEIFRMIAEGTRIQILWALIDGSCR